MLEVTQLNGFEAERSIVSAGLILELDAGNTGSYPGTGTTWTDLSGNGKNGTLVNSPTFATTGGGIINYAGTARVSTALTVGATYSMSVWFRLTSVTNGSFGALLGVYQSKYQCMIMDGSLSLVRVYVENQADGDAFDSSTISANTFYNYVLVREGDSTTNGYKLYVNGSLTGSRTTLTRASTDFVYVGGRPDATQTPPGGISCAHIYNRALTAAEIQQNFNALRGRFGI